MRPNTKLEQTDLRNAQDRDVRKHEVVVYFGDHSRRVLSTEPRLRTVQVAGVVYEHTHELPDGTWVYRHM